MEGKNDAVIDLECRLPTQFLWDWNWWQDQLVAVFKVVPFFLLPSFALAAANIIAVIANGSALSGIGGADVTADSTSSELTGLLVLVIILLGALIVSLVISFWALWIWLLRVTACASLYLQGEPLTKEALGGATALFRALKGRLIALWTVGSVFLLLPALPLAVLIALNIMQNMKVLGKRALEMPDWAPFALVPGIIVLSAVTLAYVLVLTVVSVRINDNPLAASKLAAQICVRHAGAVTTATIAVFAANVIVTAPQLFFSGTLIGEVLSNNMIAGIALQLWFGATAAFMWPVSVIAFAHMMRPVFSGEQASDSTKLC